MPLPGQSYCIFGESNDTKIVPASYWGQAGWFQVPPGWSVMTDSNNQIWASPNTNFSPPKYACKMNNDYTLVFQDLLLARYNHQS